jgi:hypothetical protein
MEQNEERSPRIGEMPMVLPTEAALRLRVTDLLLGGLRDVQRGRLTVEQSDVLQEIETALKAYGTHFYPPGHR